MSFNIRWFAYIFYNNNFLTVTDSSIDKDYLEKIFDCYKRDEENINYNLEYSISIKSTNDILYNVYLKDYIIYSYQQKQ